MLKLALIPIGVLSSFVFLFALAQTAPLPFAVVLILSLLLTIPSILPLLADKLARGKLRTTVQRISEAIAVPYLYLLIFLLADAAVIFLFRAFGDTPHPGALFGVTFALYAGVLTVGLLHARKIVVKRYELRFKDGKEGRGRTRAVVFSDLHLGFFTTKGLLTRLGAKIGEERPDLLLFAGDLFDSDFSELRLNKEAIAFFSSLSCRDGCYLCAGNHDVYTRGDPRLTPFLRACGATMLRDERSSAPFFDFFGRKDKGEERLDAKEVCASTERRLVVLDHHPGEPQKLIDGGACLVLCGHVHNGQTFPGNIFAAITGKYGHGLKKYKDGYVLTTAGVGYCGTPIRFLVSNEIAVLDLIFE